MPAGVIYQTINLTIFVDRCFDQVLNVFSFAHVAADKNRLAARMSVYLAFDGRARVFVSAAEHDF